MFDSEPPTSEEGLSAVYTEGQLRTGALREGRHLKCFGSRSHFVHFVIVFCVPIAIRVIFLCVLLFVGLTAAVSSISSSHWEPMTTRKEKDGKRSKKRIRMAGASSQGVLLPFLFGDQCVDTNMPFNHGWAELFGLVLIRRVRGQCTGTQSYVRFVKKSRGSRKNERNRFCSSRKLVKEAGSKKNERWMWTTRRGWISERAAEAVARHRYAAGGWERAQRKVAAGAAR